MRWHSSPLCVLLFTTLIGWLMASGLKICAFKMDRFNSNKLSNSRLKYTMMRILSHCDITLLQGVIDPDLSVAKTLTAAVNRYSQRYKDSLFNYVSSEGLGKDKQRYLFIYRKKMVNVTDKHQYVNSTFLRPPFSVKFQSSKTKIQVFALVPLHADPAHAVQEIDKLLDVCREVQQNFNTSNLMLLGDFHAGCAHMTRPDKKRIRLFSDPKFFWLIGDRTDSTVDEKTSCPYDRIVVYGKTFLKSIKAFSTKVYNYAKEFKVPKNQVMQLSQHFPVMTVLKSSAHLYQATPLLLVLSVVLWAAQLSL
ncbi:deoxyribonuclease-1-like 2 [Thalassophryne amazonica]|uniref:deoxyribonuclease-1-like 2 n=1 Tax=Thalassophryne amazonica TaxID=390379 RepID=UPI0014720BB2|nr:deoxyribonuclease-1-like 2 [Thalassophryne amazonica]